MILCQARIHNESMAQEGGKRGLTGVFAPAVGKGKRLEARFHSRDECRRSRMLRKLCVVPRIRILCGQFAAQLASGQQEKRTNPKAHQGAGGGFGNGADSELKIIDHDSLCRVG